RGARAHAVGHERLGGAQSRAPEIFRRRGSSRLGHAGEPDPRGGDQRWPDPLRRLPLLRDRDLHVRPHDARRDLAHRYHLEGHPLVGGGVLRFRAAGLLILTLCVPASTASAFDTGTHFDLTEDVLRYEGFSNDAIATAQSANFLVDFYEFIGKKEIRKYLDADCKPRLQDMLRIGDAQH